VAREYRFLTETNGKLRSLCWLSLLDDESISVGLSDRTFVARGLRSEAPLDGVIHANFIDLQSKMKPRALVNPHLTFHPPLKFHVHSNGEEEIFVGIMDVDLVVQAEGKLAWIRFVSDPLRNLKPFQRRSGQQVEVIRFLAPNDDVSMRICVDFVTPNNLPIATTPQSSLLFSNGARTIEILAKAVAPQKSSLDWYHES